MIFKIIREGYEFVTFHDNERLSATSMTDLLEHLADRVAFDTIMGAVVWENPEDLTLDVEFFEGNKDHGYTEYLRDRIESKL